MIVDEEWRDIEGYEGLYRVSNCGRIRTLERTMNCGTNMKSKRTYPDRIRKLGSNPEGYVIIALCKNGKLKHYAVHRLVALAFIPNIKSAPTVNHIDGVKNNNIVSNLEWATHSEQLKHAHKIGLIDQTGSKNPASKFHDDDILFCKELIRAGYRNIEVQYILGIPHNYVSKIRNESVRSN